MDGSEVLGSELYRLRARKFRMLAAGLHSAEAREELISMAEECEEMAEHGHTLPPPRFRRPWIYEANARN